MKLKFFKLIKSIHGWITFNDYSCLNKLGKLYIAVTFILSGLIVTGIIYLNA